MQHKLFFLHIPKCGGTSLDAAIRAGYSAPADLIAHVRLDPVASLRAAKLAGVDAGVLSQSLLYYFMAQAGVRYISGHFTYCETAHRTFGSEWEFITLLRHPVARWFSHYFYNRYKPGEHYRISEDLPTFVTSPRALRLANASVLQLTGRGMDEILARPRQCAFEAIANLEKFALVGCLERLDTFISQFAERYGARLDVPRLQTNPAPPSLQAAQIDDALRQRVEEMCRMDVQVYEHALSRWVRS